MSGPVAVTGAGGGLGGAVAARLARAGRPLALFDVVAEPLEKTAAAAEEAGVAVTRHVVDISDVAAVRSELDRARTDLGPLTGLVNAAGIGGFTTWEDLEPDAWDAIYAVNVRGLVFATQHLARAAAEDDVEAAVVNFSSIAARNGNELLTAYGSSKAAVLAATQSLSRALAPRVRVNAVLPGLIWTDMWRGAAGWLSEREPAFAGAEPRAVFDAMVAQTIPMGRPQTADDVAAAVEFLLSDAAANITGQSLHVDGGSVVP